jgi:hypothetical protein
MVSGNIDQHEAVQFCQPPTWYFEDGAIISSFSELWRIRHCGRPCAVQHCVLWTDCVEKLVVFGPLMLVITLISFGCS